VSTRAVAPATAGSVGDHPRQFEDKENHRIDAVGSTADTFRLDRHTTFPEGGKRADENDVKKH
jgi:hypothetical protein